jgi:hypothetical protein
MGAGPALLFDRTITTEDAPPSAVFGRWVAMLLKARNLQIQKPSRSAVEIPGLRKPSLLRNSTPRINGGTKYLKATERRDVKARPGGAERPPVEQTESPSANGTSFVTDSNREGRGSLSLDVPTLEAQRWGPPGPLNIKRLTLLSLPQDLFSKPHCFQ